MTRPQKSSCCGAPLVLCKGAAWDVAPDTIQRGSTYYYGCTECRQATDPTPFTLSELRQQIRDHMWALAGDDKTARGSVDYGDFLIDQLLEEVIGEDEPLTGNGGKYAEVRNGLRGELREASAKVMGDAR